MILSILTCLALLAALLRSRGSRRLSNALFATSIGLFFLVACGPVARWLLAAVQPTGEQAAAIAEDWSEKPAIIVIGAGVTRAPHHHRATLPVWSAGRVMRAAELFNDCDNVRSDCLIFLSGGKPGLDQVTEADLFAEHLQALGVPKQQLVLERDSDNTWENVQFIAPLLREHHRAGRPIVLTSGIHAWRTERYFRAFGIEVVAIPTDYLDAEISFVPLALNLALADLALHEIIGMARLHLYSALGWND